MQIGIEVHNVHTNELVGLLVHVEANRGRAGRDCPVAFGPLTKAAVYFRWVTAVEILAGLEVGWQAGRELVFKNLHGTGRQGNAGSDQGSRGRPGDGPCLRTPCAFFHDVLL
jgi:hypothetical protein